MRFIYTHILFFIFIFFVFIAYGQRRDSAHVLETVKVISSKNTNTVSSPVPVQILSDSTIQRLNSFSVADALRYFAGVQIKDYGGIGGLKTVNTRSLGSTHTALFYDGVPITNLQNGQIDLGKFSLDNIEEIRLYNAGNTNMLQPAIAYASGASIYLTSRQPRFDYKQNTNLKATFKTGSFGLVNPSILWQQKINNHYNLSLSAEHTHADGKYKFRYKVDDAYDTTATRENANINANRIEIALLQNNADNSSWSTRLYYYTSERGLPGAVVSNRFANAQKLWENNFFLQSMYKKRVSKIYEWMLTGKFAYDHTKYIDPDIVGIGGELINNYDAREYYISSANRFSILPFWKVLLSVDARWNELNANLDNFAYPSRKTLLGLIASDFSWDRIYIQGNILGTFNYDKVKTGPKQPDRKEYSPTLSFSWQPFATNNLHLRGFYKNVFRMPTFNDLYYTNIGYVNLRPEFTKQYDVGIVYDKQVNSIWTNFSLQSDAYINTIKDKILATPSSNLFRWRMTNIDKVHITGITNALRSSWQWEAWRLSMIAQYTWEKTLNKTHGIIYNMPVPYSPRNATSVASNLMWKQLELNYSYLYTGKRYNTTDITLPNSLVQPWYTHDVSIVWNGHWNKWKSKIAFEVNNLFNQQYEVILNYPMPGRNYKVTVQITI